MKSQNLLAVAFGALLAMPVAAHAQITGAMTSTAPAASGTSNLSADDKDFILKAHNGGLTEIETSKLAKKTSSNDSIKAFAQDMIDDHKKADAKLKKIAKDLNVTVPKDLDAEHQAQVDQLKNAKGGDFDQKYVAIQDKGHNETIAAFQKEADNGDNSQLKDFAAKTLPELQMHLQKIKALEAKVPAAASSK